MKRAIGAVLVVLALAVAAHAWGVTQRDRRFRHLIAQGEQALLRGDSFAAVTSFSDAIERRPDSMLGYLKRGDAYRRRGELEAAVKDLEMARHLDPTEPRTLELLGDVASARRRFGDAAMHYQAYVALDDRPRVLYKLGLVRQMAGQHKEATETLRQAVTLDSRFAEAHYLLGLSLRALNQLPAAESALERAVAVSPTLLRAREELADVYALAGKRSERLRQLEELLLADASPGRQVAVAVAYADTGQVSRAVRVLGNASRLYPDHAGTYLALGEIWLRAAADGQDRIALSKALEALQHAVSMEASSRALTLLGRARLLAADAPAAERTLRQATETLPADLSAFLLLADAAERTGHPRIARSALIDYQKLTGTADPRFLLRVAEAHWRAGDASGARSAVAAVLARQPDNEAARALQQRLR